MIGFKQRGLRNNNPFNIKKSNQPWLGKKKVSDDPTFEQFDTIIFGLRAGLKLLTTYVNRGYDTPLKIIGRFAPSTENNSVAYTAFVCGDKHYPFGVSLCFDEQITSLYKLCVVATRILIYENALTPIMVENLFMTPSDLEKLCNKYHLLIKI